MDSISTSYGSVKLMAQLMTAYVAPQHGVKPRTAFVGLTSFVLSTIELEPFLSYCSVILSQGIRTGTIELEPFLQSCSGILLAAMLITCSQQRGKDNRLRALQETTGHRPFERQHVASPSRDDMLRALRETTGHKPLGQTSGYEPFERRQVTSPRSRRQITSILHR